MLCHMGNVIQMGKALWYGLTIVPMGIVILDVDNRNFAMDNAIWCVFGKGGGDRCLFYV